MSCSVVANSLQPHGLQPTRLLCPWYFPDKDTGVGCHFLLQGIFPIQGLNPGLLHCTQILYQLSYKGNPRPVLKELKNKPWKDQTNSQLSIKASPTFFTDQDDKIKSFTVENLQYLEFNKKLMDIQRNMKTRPITKRKIALPKQIQAQGS